MKKCNKCGTEYENFATYCNACDISLDGELNPDDEINSDIDPKIITMPKKRLIKTHQLLCGIQLLIIALFFYDLVIYKAPSANGVGLLLFLSIFPLVHFLTARGIKNGKNWSQSVSMVMAFVFLFGFPIGTAVGVFMLINLFNKGWDAKRQQRSHSNAIQGAAREKTTLH